MCMMPALIALTGSDIPASNFAGRYIQPRNLKLLKGAGDAQGA